MVGLISQSPNYCISKEVVKNEWLSCFINNIYGLFNKVELEIKRRRKRRKERRRRKRRKERRRRYNIIIIFLLWIFFFFFLIISELLSLCCVYVVSVFIMDLLLLKF
jgi:polyferredoxin